MTLQLPSSTIGVFDSGIGGLSVLAALRAELPAHDFVYAADSAHSPYGERDTAYVLERSRKLVNWLYQQRISILVLACNTATAAAIEQLRAEFPQLPMVGVEPALKPACLVSKTGHVGVLATRSTLASRRFQALLAAQVGSAHFTLQACDGLADAIEQSAISGDTTQTLALCQKYTSMMGTFGDHDEAIDTLVLGCTHYPFVSDQLQQLLGSGVQLLSNGAAVARQARRLLTASMPTSSQAETTSKLGNIRLVSTGQAQTLQAAANRWLGLEAVVEVLAI
ncbi:Glutamate racemase [Polaromonas vacuolata]|uniref:Glutamate racemase n=1 Tax=Polaromonas vacuolata TaxID=37448 RepID=A0A6H2HBC7_9BURK|nr:Glutamate racemase [Polaromonas vacuolata]